MKKNKFHVLEDNALELSEPAQKKIAVFSDLEIQDLEDEEEQNIETSTVEPTKLNLRKSSSASNNNNEVQVKEPNSKPPVPKLNINSWTVMAE